MTPQDPNDGWMQLYPEVAALLAGVLAAIIRATAVEGPRRWRAVLGDALGTMALGWLVYRGVLGLGGIPDLAFGAAGMAGAVGWEVVRRRVLPKLLNRMGG